MFFLQSLEKTIGTRKACVSCVSFIQHKKEQVSTDLRVRKLHRQGSDRCSFQSRH